MSAETLVHMQISPLYATVFVASMLFPALSTIFKEQMFTKAKEMLKGKQLDIFVVRFPLAKATDP
jgi:hypothetical protein